MNAKDFVLTKTEEIIQICDDLHYIKNEELRLRAVLQIEAIANRIKENLEHLDIKVNKEGD